MKKAIKLFVVIAMTISASFANANETTFKVRVVGEKKFRVEVSDVQGASVAYIKDNNGQVLYKSRSKSDLLRITFDVSKLREGQYDLIVKDQSKVRTLPVNITGAGVSVDADDLRKTFFPIVEKKEDVVMVKLLSDASNDLSIDVRALNGDLLAEDIVEGQLGLIGKKYQFNPGNYAITVRSDNFVDTSYITIK